MGKLKSWSRIVLNNKNIHNLSHLRTKFKCYAKNADAHKKQCESLPPEKKIKILQTNADAHKKKRELHSPEDRDLFDKNHSAAQHKYYESLSPDQKAQVLTIDADTKNTESFYLLNRKSKL